MAKTRRKLRRRRIEAELSILRLAAQALDTREFLTKTDLERVPSLTKAFNALDSVLVELGWGDFGPISGRA